MLILMMYIYTDTRSWMTAAAWRSPTVPSRSIIETACVRVCVRVLWTATATTNNNNSNSTTQSTCINGRVCVNGPARLLARSLYKEEEEEDDDDDRDNK